MQSDSTPESIAKRRAEGAKYARLWRKNNPEAAKALQDKAKAKRNATQEAHEEWCRKKRERYYANLEVIKAARKALYRKQRETPEGEEKIRAERREYKRRNRAKVNAKARQWSNDPAVKARHRANVKRQERRRELHRQRRHDPKTRPKFLAAKRNWARRNADKISKQRAALIYATPESHARYLERAKKDRDKHPDRVANCNRRARAARAKAEGSHTVEDIKVIWKRQKHKCAVKGCTYAIAASGKNRYHIDHVKALINGGSDSPDNLQILCRRHNLQKKDKDEYLWAQTVHGTLFPI